MPIIASQPAVVQFRPNPHGAPEDCQPHSRVAPPQRLKTGPPWFLVSQSTIHPQTWYRGTETNLLVSAARCCVTSISTGSYRCDEHASFGHFLERELVQFRSNSSSRVIGMHGVQPNLSDLSFLGPATWTQNLQSFYQPKLRTPVEVTLHCTDLPRVQLVLVSADASAICCNRSPYDFPEGAKDWLKSQRANLLEIIQVFRLEAPDFNFAIFHSKCG